MQLKTFLVACGLVAASTMPAVGAQSAVRTPAPHPPAVPAGATVNAELKSKLDAKKAKAGDIVIAVTTSDVKRRGRKILPKGTRISGRITAVTAARNGKTPSKIALLFERAKLKQGGWFPLRAVIVNITDSTPGAIGDDAGALSDMNNMGMSTTPDPMSPGMNGVGLGGLTGGLAGTTSATDAAMLGRGETEPTGQASNGLPLDIAIPPAGAGGIRALGTVLSTPRGNLQLYSGTRMQIEIVSGKPVASAGGAGQVPVQPPVGAKPGR